MQASGRKVIIGFNSLYSFFLSFLYLKFYNLKHKEIKNDGRKLETR